MKFSISSLVSALDPYQPSSFAVGLDIGVSGWYQDQYENCLVEIVSWKNSNMLKINADKTEVIVFTSQKNEKHIESISVKIGGEDIKPSKCVRNLGAFLNSKMSMEKHINADQDTDNYVK